MGAGDAHTELERPRLTPSRLGARRGCVGEAGKLEETPVLVVADDAVKVVSHCRHLATRSFVAHSSQIALTVPCIARALSEQPETTSTDRHDAVVRSTLGFKRCRGTEIYCIYEQDVTPCPLSCGSLFRGSSKQLRCRQTVMPPLLLSRAGDSCLGRANVKRKLHRVAQSCTFGARAAQASLRMLDASVLDASVGPCIPHKEFAAYWALT